MICGSCAKKNLLSLEERIELALSRVPGHKYVCGFCRVLHSLKVSDSAAPIPITPIVSTPAAIPKKLVLKKRPVVEVSDYEQLKMFDMSDHISLR